MNTKLTGALMLGALLATGTASATTFYPGAGDSGLVDTDTSNATSSTSWANQPGGYVTDTLDADSSFAYQGGVDYATNGGIAPGTYTADLPGGTTVAITEIVVGTVDLYQVTLIVILA